MLALQSAAQTAAEELLGPETALSLWATTEALTLPELARKAKEAATTHFEAIATSDALLSASHAQLLALLQEEELKIASEETIFRAVVRWQAAAKPEEEQTLSLLHHVRFGLMPAEFLKSVVSVWPPMQSAGASKILMEALMSCMAGGTPPTARKPPRSAIEWEVFDPNMVMSTGADGEAIFSRTRVDAFDVALGKAAITSGRHAWTVDATLGYVGVATWSCSKRVYPCNDQTGAWAVSVSRFILLCGAASSHKAKDWTALRSTGAAAKCLVNVLLDMDARTLSFSRDDGPMRVAYIGLPESVHPYLCSGNVGEVFKVLLK